MTSQPPVMPSYIQQPPQPKRGPLPWLIGILVVLLLAVGGLALALVVQNSRSSDSKPAAPTPADRLLAASRACDTGQPGMVFADNGQTLIITTIGEERTEGAGMKTPGCVLEHLGASAAIREHVSTTRAIDGQQTDSWPGFTARWTYHPDDGLQITIRTA